MKKGQWHWNVKPAAVKTFAEKMATFLTFTFLLASFPTFIVHITLLSPSLSHKNTTKIA